MTQLENKAYDWLAFLHHVDPAQFSQNLTYFTSKGEERSLPYAATLLHVFNHGTHHRGQMTAALTALGYTCPELDLLYMLIEEQPLINLNQHL